MCERYEVWFTMFNPVKMRYIDTKTRRRFDSLDEAKNCVKSLKDGSKWGVVDCEGRVIDARYMSHVRINKVWC